MQNVRSRREVRRLPNATTLSTTALLAFLFLAYNQIDAPIQAQEHPANQAPPSAPVVLSGSGDRSQDLPSPQDDPVHVQIMETLVLRHPSWTRPELERLARTIQEECERHDFEPELILAVILVESGGRPTAVSHVGALGLMQIMPPTGAEVARKLGVPWKGPSMLLDPIVNVKLGVAYLRTLTNRYEDMSTALAAYNWGPGRIDRRLRRGEELPTEYINRVTHIYDRMPGPATDRS